MKRNIPHLDMHIRIDIKNNTINKVTTKNNKISQYEVDFQYAAQKLPGTGRPLMLLASSNRLNAMSEN